MIAGWGVGWKTKKDGRDAPKEHVMKAKSGFTLIELLVVIAVIGLLAGILVPSIGAALDKGKRTQCLNHVKSISTALLGYAGDHRGHLPAVGGGKDYDSLTEMAKGLAEDEYLEDLTCWACPSDAGRTACKGRDVENFAADRNCSYLYFSGYRLMRDTVDVSKKPLLCDRARGGLKAELGSEDNHGAKGRNAAYLDGSVKSWSTAEDANGVVNAELPDGVDIVE